MKRVKLAIVLVEPDLTVPSAAADVLKKAQRFFPTLPILLLAPRGAEDPLAYATFSFEALLPYIDPDDIVWNNYSPVVLEAAAPF